ncbi:MAG: diguanylate cyclase [Planctomycetaceae bacterium]|nr:diguanylate cyclase [Planctomycetaceae bacterium]
MIDKKLLLTILLLLGFTPSGCDLDRGKTVPSVGPITTYRDIPGVTAEEIVAIEALKVGREKLTLGAMIGTESFPLPDGSYDGFSVRYCDFLTELFGIRFVVEIHEWDVLMERLDAGLTDFTGSLTPTEERRKKYSMTLPIAERMHRIFTLEDSPIQTETDLEGRTIAFLEDTTTEKAIRKVYRFFFKSVEVADYPEAVQMLKNGEIDGFIDEADADPAFDEYDFIRSLIIFPMVHSPVSMTTANPELAPVISVIDKFIASKGGGDKLFELYKEGDFAYARNKLSRLLTEEEKAYIGDLAKRGAAVPVIFEMDCYPLNFFNRKEGEFQGIAMDVLAEISRLLDIKFEVVSSTENTWENIYEMVKVGKVPMTTFFAQTEPRMEYFIWSDVPYSRSYYALISRSDFPNLASHQVAQYTVGVTKLSAYEDVYHKLFPDNKNLKKYDSLSACLYALEKGEFDLLMASEYALITQTHYREKSQFKINLQLGTSLDSYFGFNKNEKILRSIISKTQQFVQTDVIENRWMNRAYDYSKKLSENQVFFMVIIVIAVTLMLVSAVILLVRNLKLSLKLRELASKDALTNILNRRCFMEQGLVQAERSLRTGQKCFIVLYDLDYFKTINDKYGHLAGDKVLKKVTQRVKAAIRPYDLHGRYGGEEFILLMIDIDETSLANAIERLRQSICEPMEIDSKRISVSASFGISAVTPPLNMDTAIKFADEALYQAKQTGRNRVVFYGKEP